MLNKKICPICGSKMETETYMTGIPNGNWHCENNECMLGYQSVSEKHIEYIQELQDTNKRLNSALDDALNVMQGIAAALHTFGQPYAGECVFEDIARIKQKRKGENNEEGSNL